MFKSLYSWLLIPNCKFPKVFRTYAMTTLEWNACRNIKQHEDINLDFRKEVGLKIDLSIILNLDVLNEIFWNTWNLQGVNKCSDNIQYSAFYPVSTKQMFTKWVTFLKVINNINYVIIAIKSLGNSAFVKWKQVMIIYLDYEPMKTMYKVQLPSKLPLDIFKNLFTLQNPAY